MHQPASIRYKIPDKEVGRKWHLHMTALCKIHFMDNSPCAMQSICHTWAIPEPVFSGCKEQITACNCRAKEKKVLHVRTYHVRVSTAQNANQCWMLLWAGLAHLVNAPGCTLNNKLTGHSQLWLLNLTRTIKQGMAGTSKSLKSNEVVTASSRIRSLKIPSEKASAII